MHAYSAANKFFQSKHLEKYDTMEQWITVADFFFRDPPATNELELLFIPVASTMESTNLVIFFATPRAAFFGGMATEPFHSTPIKIWPKVYDEYDTHIEFEGVYHLLELRMHHDRSKIFRVFNVHNGNSPLLY